MQRTQNEFGEIAYNAHFKSFDYRQKFYIKWGMLTPNEQRAWNEIALAVLKAERAQAEGYPQVAHV